MGENLTSPQSFLTLKATAASMRLPVTVAVLASCASLAMGLVVNFTGNVVTDFPAGSGVFIAADATNDVFFTNGGVLNPTGWNIHDVRFAYDAASDTAYFGKGARVGSGCDQLWGRGLLWPSPHQYPRAGFMMLSLVWRRQTSP